MKNRSLQLSLKLKVYAGLIGLLLSGFPPQSTAAPDPKILEAAKKEVQLMWYNTLVQPHARKSSTVLCRSTHSFAQHFRGVVAIECIPGCQPRPEQDDTNGM